MIHSAWDESEKAAYRQLTRHADAPTSDLVENLAYTAVMEMYHRRKLEEQVKAEHGIIKMLLGQLADGIHTVERMYGTTLNEMERTYWRKRHEEERVYLRRFG